MIKFHKTTPTSIIPTRGTDGAAGFDLYATSSRHISQGEQYSFGTGVVTEFSPDIAGQIWPRSGMAVKHGIGVQAGVIDSDYRGEIHVCLINHHLHRSFYVHAGDRIAQILFIPIITHAVEADGYLSETDRGQDGFGSTGR